jgi:hypothetical protein
MSTASIVSSETVRSAPGRGVSQSPSRWSSQKRHRHFETVVGFTPRKAATSLSDLPSVQASTIRERWPRAWEELRRRTQRSRSRAHSRKARSLRSDVPVLPCSLHCRLTRENAPREGKFPIREDLATNQPGRSVVNASGRP